MSHDSPSAERPLEGGAFYDNPRVFERYRAHRSTLTNPNDLIEQPALLDLLGSVRGLRVLDLGCGAGSFGRTLMDLGWRSYLGIDASQNMVSAAQQRLQDTPGQVRHEAIVDDYFTIGRRETDWLGGRVVKYHRTIEDYVRLVQEQAFRLDRLSEARPRPEHFTSEAEFRRRTRIPMFLMLAATAL